MLTVKLLAAAAIFGCAMSAEVSCKKTGDQTSETCTKGCYVTITKGVTGDPVLAKGCQSAIDGSSATPKPAGDTGCVAVANSVSTVVTCFCKEADCNAGALSGDTGTLLDKNKAGGDFNAFLSGGSGTKKKCKWGSGPTAESADCPTDGFASCYIYSATASDAASVKGCSSGAMTYMGIAMADSDKGCKEEGAFTACQCKGEGCNASFASAGKGAGGLAVAAAIVGAALAGLWIAI
jgi:hypothetical protein